MRIFLYFNLVGRFLKSGKERRCLKINSSLLLSIFISLSPGCYDSYGINELKIKREELLATKERIESSNSIENEALQKEIDDLKPRYEEALALEANLKELQSNSVKIRKEIEDYEIELRNEMAVLNACLQAFKIRALIEPGTKYDTIQLKDGKKLVSVTYKGIKGDKVSFAHSAGFGSFPITQLPPDLESRFILPPPKPISSVDPELILSRKPDILKSSDQIAKARELKYKRETEQREEKDAQQKMIKRQEYEKRATASAAYSKALREKHQLISSLKLKLSNLQSQLKKHQSDVRKDDEKYEDSKFRVSKAERKKITDSYRARERILSEQIFDTKKEILEAEK